MSRGAGARRGGSRGSFGDDRRPRAVPRRPYAHDAARIARALRRFDGRRRLQDQLYRGVARRSCADRLGLRPLSCDRHVAGLDSANSAKTPQHRPDAAGRHPGGGLLYKGPHLRDAEASDAIRREIVGVRPSARERRSRRHHPVRLVPGLGRVRPRFAETPRRSRCAADSRRRRFQRPDRGRGRDRRLSRARLRAPPGRDRRASDRSLAMSVQSAVKRKTAPEIRARKGGEPIVMLTSYHAHTAALVDRHCDMILVGDSLGNVMHGFETTVPVTLEMMILQGRAVMRGSRHALVVVDMPFGSYEASKEQAFHSAARILKETQCGAVKLEGGVRMAETVSFLATRGIPVMGHIGLTPQSINTLGSFRAQGREEGSWQPIEDDARAIAKAGAFSIVIEAVAEPLARKITETIAIPTIGIGASAACDGQVLVLEDMLGLSARTPKFVRRYGDIGPMIEAAIEGYATDVRARAFPGPEHVYGMKTKT